MAQTGDRGQPPLIVVVGSINMDLVASMERLPRPGETVLGDSFQAIPGGKGANQAVAAARLGARVAMIGRIGADTFGGALRQNLDAAHVDSTSVWETSDCASGVALINVERKGVNSITVIPGANGRLSVEDIQASRSIIQAADALIVQLETPTETVAAAIQIAREYGILIVLDPAPAPSSPLPRSLLSADVLSPNQTEAEALTGIVVCDEESAMAAAKALQQQGANDIVLKLGSLGALICTRDGFVQLVPAQAAEIVDSTAAGDAFTAALVVALCEGRSLGEATQFGCLAGTIACTRFGAQPSLPTRREVDAWLARTRSAGGP